MNELTNITREAFKENTLISMKIAQLVDEIASVSEEQARGISQVNLADSEMDKATQSTAANAEEPAAAEEELTAQAERMKVYVGDPVTVVGGNSRDTKGGGNGPALTGQAALLPEALERFGTILLLTHVPPFREACRHQGQPTQPAWLPHFSCRAVGEVVIAQMSRYQNRKMIVLCGHTHEASQSRISKKVVVMVACAIKTAG